MASAADAAAKHEFPAENRLLNEHKRHYRTLRRGFWQALGGPRCTRRDGVISISQSQISKRSRRNWNRHGDTVDQLHPLERGCRWPRKKSAAGRVQKKSRHQFGRCPIVECNSPASKNIPIWRNLLYRLASRASLGFDTNSRSALIRYIFSLAAIRG